MTLNTMTITLPMQHYFIFNNYNLKNNRIHAILYHTVYILTESGKIRTWYKAALRLVKVT